MKKDIFSPENIKNFCYIGLALTTIMCLGKIIAINKEIRNTYLKCIEKNPIELCEYQKVNTNLYDPSFYNMVDKFIKKYGD